MKTALAVFSGALILLVMTSSCTKDPCESKVCQNDGVCSDGKCLCPVGYEGDNCETETRAKFYGTYVGQMSAGGQTQNATATLMSYPDNVRRIFWDDNRYLELAGTNTADIPLQTIFDFQNGTYTIDGLGSLSDNQLVLTFLATYQFSQPVLYKFIGTK